MTRAPLAAILLMCAAGAAAERHAFDDSRAAAAIAPPPAPTHAIRLAVVILRGSPWTYDAVARRVAKTREIVAQCGVRLDPEISELSSPSGSPDVVYDPDHASEKAGMGTISSALGQTKPTLFYIRAFSDNGGQSGTSRPAFQARGAAEEDTAWVPFPADGADAEHPYLVDAHELVHVIADTPHADFRTCAPRAHKEDPISPECADQGLMVGNPMLRSNRISDALCARIKERPYARPL